MLKILVITTGGTIGSSEENGVINISEAGSTHIQRMFGSEYRGIGFEHIPLMNILSENLRADDLDLLAKTLLTLDYTPYNGVIVTCGSDNLAYLASFIGLLTYRKCSQVIIVAADKPLFELDSNGIENLCTAVELISNFCEGPCVPYRDSRGMRIHSATDIRQADLSNDFYNFSGKYNTVTGKNIHRATGIVLDDNYVLQTVPDVFDAEHLPNIGDDVLMIHPYPLMDYDAINIDGKKAVLHTLYHSSTLNSEGAISLLKRLGDVPMYLASFRSENAIYQSAADVINAGAIPLYDISPECAYMKLVLACAQDRMSIREFMEA